MSPSAKTYASLYISKDLRAKAQAVAESRRRSFNEYVVTLIERDIREADRRRLDSPAEIAATSDTPKAG